MAGGGEMRAPTLLILTALADGPKHGYSLLAETERASGGRVRLQVGTLYAALDRLQGEGLIAVSREEEVGGRLRRYLELTDAGQTALEDEVQRLETVAREARARLRARSTRKVALDS